MIAVVFYVDIDAENDLDPRELTEHRVLTAARIEEIRDRLGNELTQVKQRLAEVWPRKALAAHEGRHHASVDHIKEGQRATDLYDRLQERRAEIVGTLNRINDGAFGRCVICGDSISCSQLEESPETVICMTCRQ